LFNEKIHFFRPTFSLCRPLTGALLVRVFLKRHLSVNQWCSLLMLFVGLIVTQQSEIFYQV
jgi:hypothetical protein